MDTYRNQSGILNVDEFDYLDVAVIGCGSIGSFLALGLSKLGLNNLMLIDGDKIENHNVPTQFYYADNVGNNKADILKSSLRNYAVKSFPMNLAANHILDADVVFICVDSLKARKIALKCVLDSYAKNKKPKLIIDGRMFRLMFRVFTIDITKQSMLNKYTKSLLGKEFSGKCTEKGIIQNVFAVTAVMLEQLKKVLNSQEYHAIINCDFDKYQFQNMMESR